MTGWYTAVERYDVEHPSEDGRLRRLGRHRRFDSRSLSFAFPSAGVQVASVTHARQIPILDQGDVGSCTGNAMTGALGTLPDFLDLPAAHPALDEAEALRIYSAAEVIDGDGPYPPNDNGSSGLSVCKAAKNAGLISGYQWCMTTADIDAALQSGPVLIGIDWYSSFDAPGASGLIARRAGDYVRGGHELELRGLDVAADEYLGDNSWGTGWGAGGSFRIKRALMQQLLSAGGDCVYPVPLSAPAPVPTPTPVPPTPGPTPPPDADHALWQVAGPWAAQRRERPDLVRLKDALETWAADKGFA
jgi:hypothetical protein